jgi:hypothetical protein
MNQKFMRLNNAPIDFGLCHPDRFSAYLKSTVQNQDGVLLFLTYEFARNRCWKSLLFEGPIVQGLYRHRRQLRVSLQFGNVSQCR